MFDFLTMTISILFCLESFFWYVLGFFLIMLWFFPCVEKVSLIFSITFYFDGFLTLSFSQHSPLFIPSKPTSYCGNHIFHILAWFAYCIVIMILIFPRACYVACSIIVLLIYTFSFTHYLHVYFIANSSLIVNPRLLPICFFKCSFDNVFIFTFTIFMFSFIIIIALDMLLSYLMLPTHYFEDNMPIITDIFVIQILIFDFLEQKGALGKFSQNPKFLSNGVSCIFINFNYCCSINFLS